MTSMNQLHEPYCTSTITKGSPGKTLGVGSDFSVILSGLRPSVGEGSGGACKSSILMSVSNCELAFPRFKIMESSSFAAATGDPCCSVAWCIKGLAPAFEDTLLRRDGVLETPGPRLLGRWGKVGLWREGLRAVEGVESSSRRSVAIVFSPVYECIWKAKNRSQGCSAVVARHQCSFAWITVCTHLQSQMIISDHEDSCSIKQSNSRKKHTKDSGWAIFLVWRASSCSKCSEVHSPTPRKSICLAYQNHWNQSIVWGNRKSGSWRSAKYPAWSWQGPACIKHSEYAKKERWMSLVFCGRWSLPKQALEQDIFMCIHIETLLSCSNLPECELCRSWRRHLCFVQYSKYCILDIPGTAAKMQVCLPTEDELSCPSLQVKTISAMYSRWTSSFDTKKKAAFGPWEGPTSDLWGGSLFILFGIKFPCKLVGKGLWGLPQSPRRECQTCRFDGTAI